MTSFGANYQSCDNSLNIFNKTCDLVGFKRQESKGTLPDQQIEALGLTINTVTRELRVSPDKLIEIYNILCECPEVKVCTKRNLLSLIGKLSFTSQAVRAGRTFLRRLIGLSKNGKISAL